MSKFRPENTKGYSPFPVTSPLNLAPWICYTYNHYLYQYYEISCITVCHLGLTQTLSLSLLAWYSVVQFYYFYATLCCCQGHFLLLWIGLSYSCSSISLLYSTSSFISSILSSIRQFFLFFPLLSQCFCAISLVSSVFTIFFNVYTLSLTTSGIWLSESYLISVLSFLIVALVFTYYSSHLQAYFPCPFIVTLIPSRSTRTSNSLIFANPISDCPGLSILLQQHSMHLPHRVNVIEILP